MTEVVPLVLVVVLYLGFAATGTVLAGQAINEIVQVEAPAVGIVVFGALTAVVATLGYRYIHMLGRVSTVVGVLGFTYLGIMLVTRSDVGALLGVVPFDGATFLLAISLGAGWQLTYGPYVADYSRYPPRHTSESVTFHSTLWGSVLGSQWSMTLGALIAAIPVAAGGGFLDQQVGFLGELGGGGPAAIAIYLVIVVPFMAQSLYTGPVTELLGGADISWLVGLAVTAALYFPCARRTARVPADMIYPAGTVKAGAP